MQEKLSPVTDEEWEEVNEFNKQLVEEFLEQRHLSPQTLKQYKSALRLFFRWVKDKCMNKPLYKLKARDALKFQNFLLERGLSSSAVKFKRSSVSSLCGYFEVYYGEEEEYSSFRNIYNKAIPNPSKTLVHEKKPLTVEEFEKLVETLRKKKEYQMLAYVLFTYSSGCRRGEVRQLLKEVINYEHVKDRDYYNTHPIRCKGKGVEGKVRRLSFDDVAMRAIKKWLKVRGDDDCPYVFVSMHHADGSVSQLSAETFGLWCKDEFSHIVGRRVHPHMFRSTRATHLVSKEGKAITSAQELLGHKSSTTTELYVIRETNEGIDDVFS